MPSALDYFLVILVDDVEGVTREGPDLLFHAEDGLAGCAVGGINPQGWGDGLEIDVRHGGVVVCGCW